MSKYSKPTLEKVQIHPLVLLSVTDHYDRVAKDTKKRVVGCLLGSRTGNVLDVTNSFAVPFDEAKGGKDTTWFLDFNYLEDLAYMFKRVNSNERIVGWYSSGPKLKKNDIDIHKLFYEYNSEPICAVIDVSPYQSKDNDDDDNDNDDDDDDDDDEKKKEDNNDDDDTNINEVAAVYVGIDVVQNDGRHEKEFAHVDSVVESSEAEEVGVEHLLREIQDITLRTLTKEVESKLIGLKGLAIKLKEIKDYLSNVLEKKLPINQDILRNLQLIFNLLPNLNRIDLIESFCIKKNDIMLNIYIASLLRSILALDQLLENKLKNKRLEEKKEADAKKAKKDAEKKQTEDDTKDDKKDDNNKKGGKKEGKK